MISVKEKFRIILLDKILLYNLVSFENNINHRW